MTPSTIISPKILVAMAVAALAKNSGNDAAEDCLGYLTTDDSTTTPESKSLENASATDKFAGGLLALSPNGQILAGADSIKDKTIKLWDLRTGQLLRTMGHCHSVVAVAFSSDGQTLVSGSEDTTIKIWDLRTGELLRTMNKYLA
ncbi:MAG TPA: hypothetical protein V6D12_15335 [Candidatus Obscuribacterales bacterium]